ncbi:MAG: YlxR family protein [Ferrimicrobium sp.]
MCVGCRKRRATCELIRLARHDGDVQVGARVGRGAWICADSPLCAEEALRGARLSKALRIPISPARLAGLQDSLGVRKGTR